MGSQSKFRHVRIVLADPRLYCYICIYIYMHISLNVIIRVDEYAKETYAW